MSGRLLAWANLGAHFLLHLARRPATLLRPGAGATAFRRAVEAEGSLPLTPEERDAFPSAMGCIHCGLCTLVCPVLREAGASAWAEAGTFVVGASRSIDRPSLLEPPACEACGACTHTCPAGVPIPQLAARARRLANGGGPGGETGP